MTQDEIRQLQAAAAHGDADSQYRLAMLHIYGDGVAEDNVLAFSLLQSAAAQGHIEAAYNLGICYHYGYGTASDLSAALSLYMKSAQAGYGKGMELVGRFYSRGIGMSRDRVKAEHWLRLAAESSDSDARDEALRELSHLG